MSINEFWQWFSVNREILAALDPSQAAERIQANLALYDKRLGVEISDEDKVREVTITANRNIAAFSSAEQLIENALDCKGWVFYALIPPRGFDFVISIGNVKLDASALSFDPLSYESEPHALGVRVFVPNVEIIDDHVSEIVHLVVQTGLGEKESAVIAHIEVARSSGDAEDALPITELGNYINWYLHRRTPAK